MYKPFLDDRFIIGFPPTWIIYIYIYLYLHLYVHKHIHRSWERFMIYGMYVSEWIGGNKSEHMWGNMLGHSCGKICRKTCRTYDTQVYRDASDDAQMAELGPDDRDRPDSWMVSPLKMEQGLQTWPSRPWNWCVLANTWSYLGLICLNLLWLSLTHSTTSSHRSAGTQDWRMCSRNCATCAFQRRAVSSVVFSLYFFLPVLLILRQFGSQVKLLGAHCA